MQGFKSPGHAQRFLAAYGPIAQHFRPRRHLLAASEYRQEMAKRFESWAEITGTKRVAYKDKEDWGGVSARLMSVSASTT
jgi:putative transposase